MENKLKAGIITFHDTPNYGATLQCYALSSFLKSEGADVEVINYRPPHTALQYVKSLFFGKRRSLQNFQRVARFNEFVKKNLKLSGPAAIAPGALAPLARRYDLTLTGSDEVWKVDHMRKLDPTYYLPFCDTTKTRVTSYAASASTVTDLRKYADTVKPLLDRFAAIAVRDPHTAEQVEALTGKAPVQVVDPTFLWDWSKEELPPIEAKPYIALYSWLNDAEFAYVRKFADAQGWRVVCVGCRHHGADANQMGIGPKEWLQLFKHSEMVVTNFFHGVVFALLFGRKLYAHVDAAKRMKLARVLEIAGLPGRLHDDLKGLENRSAADFTYDAVAVRQHLEPSIASSKSFLRAQLAASGDKGL